MSGLTGNVDGMELRDAIRRPPHGPHATTRTARCRARWSTSCSTWPSGRRRPGTPRGGEFLVLDDVASRDRVLGGDDRAGEPDGWLRADADRPGADRLLLRQDAYLDRYAEPDKGWTDRDEARWPVPYWDIDTGMAALLMLLAAEDAGLGACFFGVPGRAMGGTARRLRRAGAARPVGVVSLGYPAPDVRSPSLRRGRRAAGRRRRYVATVRSRRPAADPSGSRPRAAPAPSPRRCAPGRRPRRTRR